MAAFGKSTVARFAEPASMTVPGPGDYDVQEVRHSCCSIGRSIAVCTNAQIALRTAIQVGANRKGAGGAVGLAYSSKKDLLEPIQKDGAPVPTDENCDTSSITGHSDVSSSNSSRLSLALRPSNRVRAARTISSVY